MASDWINSLSVDELRWKLTAALSELMEVEETLAEGLGYPRSDGGPDDPNGGGYVTGEHTSASLALEAKRSLRSERSSRQAWAEEAMRLDEAIQSTARRFEAQAQKAEDKLGEHPDALMANACWKRAATWLREASAEVTLPVCTVHPEARPNPEPQAWEQLPLFDIPQKEES